MPIAVFTVSVYAALFILGLIFGSYVNSWVWRVSRSRLGRDRGSTISAEAGIGKSRRSMCVHCGRILRWYENIPLASFIALRGKCRTCQKPIPADYFWVELFTALLFVVVTYYHLHLPALNPWHFFRDLFFTALLVVIFIYDLKYQEILTGVVWAGAIVGFAINYSLGFSTYSLVLGAAVGWSWFALQYYGSRGRWVGGGDVRLGAMLGLWLGWPQIIICLFLSYILGAFVAVPLLLTGKKGLKSEIPFGTFLAAGAGVTIFYGQTILNWYLNLLR